MTGTLATERLLAIIHTQNEITATALDVDQVMAVVVERAQELTGASGAVIELVEGDEMVYQAVSGTARPHLGLRLSAATSLSGLCVEHGEVLYCEDSGADPRVDAEACARVGALSLLVRSPVPHPIRSPECSRCTPTGPGRSATRTRRRYGSSPGWWRRT